MDKLLSKNNWIRTCESYKKHFLALMDFSDGTEYVWWVADDVGGVLCCNAGEFTIGIDDMRYIVDNSVTSEEVWEWYDYNSESWYYGENYINIRSWVKGCPRVSDAQKEIILKNKKGIIYRGLRTVIDVLTKWSEGLRRRGVR